ncbi:PfkB family carbohydrate kinase [Amycolatopsis palatopharyngis]|uniref:PfkB family carbohydrate kinase n=1 Tax=Amycolatopsis palatopharyngis TaxID=187982 RepID=UPI000E246005|nr:PfkB family carbohydrate kinase [Amycolatopsis palatopharyngis]
MPSARSGRSAPEIVVVGAINVDFVVAAPRLPGPGETVVGPDLRRYGGGKGANAAVAAARAGAVTRLIGAVGADDTGTAALAELRADGVLVDGVAELDSVATGAALIVVDPAGENQIAVGAGANAAVHADSVRTALREALPSAGCVLVSTEIPGEAVAAAVETAATAGVPCVLNPAPVQPVLADLLRHGPVLTPNVTEVAELAALLGAAPRDGGVTAAAETVLAASGAPVVVTMGGEGALVLLPGEPPQHVPPHPATVRDTTGAGDTFNGVLATRLAAGEPLTTAVQAASVAAAISVGEVGARAGMPQAAEIERAVIG